MSLSSNLWDDIDHTSLCLDAPNVTMTASQTTVTEGEDSLQLLCEVSLSSLPLSHTRLSRFRALPPGACLGRGVALAK